MTRSRYPQKPKQTHLLSEPMRNTETSDLHVWIRFFGKYKLLLLHHTEFLVLTVYQFPNEVYCYLNQSTVSSTCDPIFALYNAGWSLKSWDGLMGCCECEIYGWMPCIAYTMTRSEKKRIKEMSLSLETYSLDQGNILHRKSYYTLHVQMWFSFF